MASVIVHAARGYFWPFNNVGRRWYREDLKMAGHESFLSGINHEAQHARVEHEAIKDFQLYRRLKPDYFNDYDLMK